MNHSHHKYSLGSGSNDMVAMRARSTFGSRSSSPAASNAIKLAADAAAATFSQHSSTMASSPAHASSSSSPLSSSNGLHSNAKKASANGHHQHNHAATTPHSSGIASTSGGNAAAGIWSTPTSIEEAAAGSYSTTKNKNNKDFVQSHSCCCHKHNKFCSAAANSSGEYSEENNPAMINGSGGIQTIEDQIRAVDKVIKECDNSRKNLEQISRRLDDLNDEVKRYREFLGHEKSHRDPTLYKTVQSDPVSPYNDNICGIMSTLTSQLTKEWGGKLNSISSAMIAAQTPSTPGSKSDRN